MRYWINSLSPAKLAMEVDTLSLVIIVVSVGLTTLVCSVVGKFCAEKLLSLSKERTSQRRTSSKSCHRRRSSREIPERRCSRCDCHQIRPRALPVNSKPRNEVVVRINDDDEMIELNTFGPEASSRVGFHNPSFGAVESAPNETFMRLGIAPPGREGIGSEIQQPFISGEFSPNQTCGIKGSNIRFNLPAFHRDRQVSFRQRNYNDYEGSYLAPKTYDEITSHAVELVSHHERGSGDGQGIEESKKSPSLTTPYDRPELLVIPHKTTTAKQRTRPGSTGPIEKQNLKVVNFQNDEDEDDKALYSRLGITTNLDGDRLSPDTKMLEQEFSSGSIHIVSGSERAEETPLADEDIANMLPFISNNDIHEATKYEPTSDDEDSKISSHNNDNDHELGTVDALSDEVFAGTLDLLPNIPLNFGAPRRLTFPQKSRHCPTCSCISCDMDHRINDPFLLEKMGVIMKRNEKKRKSAEAFERALQAKHSSSSGFIKPSRKAMQDLLSLPMAQDFPSPGISKTGNLINL